MSQTQKCWAARMDVDVDWGGDGEGMGRLLRGGEKRRQMAATRQGQPGLRRGGRGRISERHNPHSAWRVR